jgi:hypothetical protein
MTKKADDRQERDRERSEEARWRVAEEGAESESETTHTAAKIPLRESAAASSESREDAKDH